MMGTQLSLEVTTTFPELWSLNPCACSSQWGHTAHISLPALHSGFASLTRTGLQAWSAGIPGAEAFALGLWSHKHEQKTWVWGLGLPELRDGLCEQRPIAPRGCLSLNQLKGKKMERSTPPVTCKVLGGRRWLAVTILDTADCWDSVW